jgi:hypothetical protein
MTKRTYILALAIITLVLGTTASANFITDFFKGQNLGASVFNSAQVGNTPANGEILQTTGTVSNWVATSTLGITATMGALNDLSDVVITGTDYGKLLMFNGSNWVNQATSTLGITASETDPIWTAASGNYLLTANAFTQAIASTTFVDRANWTTHDNYPAACTNQFVRTIGDTNTCATVGAADVSLANLTATDTTLTFSGTYTGATARTIGLNLGNANTWTALQTFANATSTLLSASYASSTLGYFGTAYLPNLAVAAGSFLAVNSTGQVIATTTPSGGSGITSLNSQTGATQTFATTSSASVNFTITSTGDIHTLNIPPASATANGLVTTGTQTFGGAKTFNSNLLSQSQMGIGSLTAGNTQAFFVGPSGEGLTSNSLYLTRGASNQQFVVAIGGDISAPTLNYSYTRLLIAGASVIEASSGNYPLMSGLAIKPSTITAGIATVSDTASLYIEGAATTTVVSGKNYSLWVDDVGGGGTSLIDGKLYIGTTTAGTLNVDTNGLVYSGAGSSGTVTSIATTFPILGGTITTTGTLTWGGLATSSAISAASGLLYATGVNTMASISTSTAVQMSITGLAGTATALAADPTDCGANNWATTIAASGNLTCSAITYAGITAMTSANFAGLISDETGSGKVVFDTSPTLITPTLGYASSTQLTVSGNIYLTTVMGAVDMGGATSFELPNGTSGFTNTTGQMFIDTTSGQLRYNSGTATSTLVNFYTTGFAYATSTAWTGTTTIFMAPAMANLTFDGVYCETNTGTVGVSLYDGTNRANYIPTASTTPNYFGYTTNNTFTAGESIRIDIGTPATTPTKASCRFKYRYDVD